MIFSGYAQLVFPKMLQVSRSSCPDYGGPLACGYAKSAAYPQASGERTFRWDREWFELSGGIVSGLNFQAECQDRLRVSSDSDESLATEIAEVNEVLANNHSNNFF